MIFRDRDRNRLDRILVVSSIFCLFLDLYEGYGCRREWGVFYNL